MEVLNTKWNEMGSYGKWIGQYQALLPPQQFMYWIPGTELCPSVGISGGFVLNILSMIQKIYTVEIVPRLKSLTSPKNPFPKSL